VNTYRRLSVVVALVVALTAGSAPHALGVTLTETLTWVGLQGDIVQSGAPCNATGTWPAPDGVTDGVFRLDITADPGTTITNLTLFRVQGGEWETQNCDGGVWGLAVSRNLRTKHVLNDTAANAGDISLVVRKSGLSVYLHADDDGTTSLFNSGDQFFVRVRFSDNSEADTSVICLISCS